MIGTDGRSWPRIAGIAAIIALIAVGLSVNQFPNINNDGVDYIAHSQALGERGLIAFGYRQIGYPLILAAERAISSVFGIEALLFASLTQRALLAVGVGYAIWLWRWKSLPVVLLVVTPSLLAYTNFILTEAMTVPLALLLACLVAHHFALTAPRWEESVGPDLPLAIANRTAAIATAWGATAVAFALLAIRFPFAVFGIVPVVIWLAARRRSAPSRPYGAALLAFLLGAGLLTIGMSVENNQEFGVLSPTVRGERSLYWSAWHLAFTLHPENVDDPALAAFYDEGSPYPRIWAIEEANPNYLVQRGQLNTSINELLVAAGFSVPRERVFSFLGALRGGRMDEVRPRVETILATDASSVEEAIHANDVSRRQGWEVFNERFNQGAKPQSVITSPAFPSPPLPYLTDTLSILLPLAFLGSLFFAWRKRQTLLGVVYLTPTLIYSAALAWLLADNSRFLMTTSVYSVAGLSALWAATDRRAAPRYRLDEHHAIDLT